tara:strand:- start:962 stop:1564 length:603 start_codon:yes stop_codon:yes gene_type:complete
MIKMASSFEVYQIYMGLKLHFTSENYDYFKYGGKTRVNIDKFYQRRNIVHFFEKLKTKYKPQQLIEYFASNFILGKTDIFLIGEDGDDVYTEWKRRIQSMAYIFQQDINILLSKVDHFDDLFKIDDGRNPVILKSYYHDDITIETFVILQNILGFFQQFDSELNDDIVWPDKKLLCSKYSIFLNMDTKKYLKILKENLNL